jgi:hypothetical protein
VDIVCLLTEEVPKVGRLEDKCCDLAERFRRRIADARRALDEPSRKVDPNMDTWALEDVGTGCKGAAATAPTVSGPTV